MPTGVYERAPVTPEHRAAISAGKMGHSVSDKTRRKISETLTGHGTTQVTRDAISESLMGHDTADDTKKKISDSVRVAWEEHPETHVEGIKKQCGGDDICDHHYIYDHSDLTKYTMKMTRSRHTWLHHLFRRAGISIPHINIEEVL